MAALPSPGLLPILPTADAATLEVFLEHDIRHCLLRSHGLTLDTYKQNLAALQILKSEWDFDFLIHHYDELYENSGAIGLHLTAASKPVRQMRQKWGAETALGFSAHSPDEAFKAEDDGADYVLLGAIFPTPKAHADHPIIGIDALHQTCTRLTIPVFAIGGISSENLWQIHAAGAYGFGALRAIFEMGNLDHNVGKLKWTWQSLTASAS